MSNFEASSAKREIRVCWNKPILQFLSHHLQQKLLYFGLPSPDAEDIYDWIDYVDRVISFQCREYGKPSDPNQDRGSVIALENRLLALERQRKIRWSYVYDGYMEEVLTLMKDNMSTPFKQDDVITLYNLDFCNQVTSPQRVINPETGEETLVYKLHLIRNLLNLQSQQKLAPKKFVMFLTVHGSLLGEEASDYTQTVAIEDIKKYHSSIGRFKLERAERNARVLRSYVFETLQSYFCNYNFIPEFLPVIKYSGTGKHTMLHFTILGTQEFSRGKVTRPLQHAKRFLEQKFLASTEDGLLLAQVHKLPETDFDTDPVSLFKQTDLFKKHWMDRRVAPVKGHTDRSSSSSSTSTSKS